MGFDGFRIRVDVMVSATVSRTGSPHAWLRIAFAMFAVGWGANQFSPMLIVYRHELRLTAGEVAGLFLVYALTLIPGLLIGGPGSDRFGRRPVAWPASPRCPSAWPTACAWSPGCGRPSTWPARTSAAP